MPVAVALLVPILLALAMILWWISKWDWHFCSAPLLEPALALPLALVAALALPAAPAAPAAVTMRVTVPPAPPPAAAAAVVGVCVQCLTYTQEGI